MAWKDSPSKSSISCDGGQIRRFRNERGWTQEALAAKAGYSARLIRKAESGQPVSPDTVEILAEALSNESHSIHPEDLIVSSGIVVRRFLDTYMAHGIETANHLAEIMHEDVRIWVAGERERVPFAGEWPGLSGLDTYFKMVSQYLEIVACDGDTGTIYVDGANVIFNGDCFWRAAGSDIVRNVWQVNHYTVERGRIAEWLNYCDTGACERLMEDWRRNRG